MTQPSPLSCSRAPFANRSISLVVIVLILVGYNFRNDTAVLTKTKKLTFFSSGTSSIAAVVPIIDTIINNDIGDKDNKYHQQNQQFDERDDADCPFRHSSIYRSVYVYPTPGTKEWTDDILSDYARDHPYEFDSNHTYPWIAIDKIARDGPYLHYDVKSEGVQYTTELLVRDILTHPESCLQTSNPNNATLFYVPYLPSTEFHNLSLYSNRGNMRTSKYAQAIMDAIQGKYERWETIFGYTSKYWKRRNGSDHILVFSDNLHGLYHPRGKRGNYHYIRTQKQLEAPIVISVELSTTFVKMYPNCSRKNIVMPFPNTDGDYFNGVLERESNSIVHDMLAVRSGGTTNGATTTTTMSSLELSPGALPVERYFATSTSLKTTSNDSILQVSPRPLGQFYKAGNHGTCTNLRKSLQKEFTTCTPSGNLLGNNELSYQHGYYLSRFCPCPGGDAPSAKRMFDALFAGCIPVVLSYDFTWPFTNQMDKELYPNLNEDDFAIRLNTSEFVAPGELKGNNNQKDYYCSILSSANYSKHSLQRRLEEVSPEEIIRLSRGVQYVAKLYSYYEYNPKLSSNPLRDSVLPTGGAAHALVEELGKRANGVLWPACQEEVRQLRSNGKKIHNPTQFKC